MYIAFTSGSTRGKSGERYEWNAGDKLPDVEKGELGHVKGIEWVEDAEVEEDSGEGLPDDMPGRDSFLKAGIETVDEVAALEDPTEVDGIGDVTAEDLAEWFKENQ